ncbi:MAG TPA: BadF/BadG/BcrA/BcrD ATPase family protein [Thermoanaerobaculia bacterium]|nr:BadF/BadG/BcrA/BcrD ATPase family protein [Thermoanaerobaculia bacterium]
MDVFVGIDLGSTTTKAVVLDGDGHVIGRGITNSRSNYDVAAHIVREEAFVRTRFTLVERETGAAAVEELERNFKLHQYLDQLDRLGEAMSMIAGGPKHAAHARELSARLEAIGSDMVARARQHFARGASRRSDFFRDLAAADFMQLAEAIAEPKGITFDVLCGVFDAAILSVEAVPIEDAFNRHIDAALEGGRPVRPDTADETSALRRAVEYARSVELRARSTVGTGYGRQRLPFPKEQIRSEILCHGLGAHAMFPETRTVLDIGGQDTKAIQLDAEGLVTSFQMNDRCAAGCGRYLGYIADEMNLAVHELGPLAQQSRQRVKINSTCTVFAGAELRERLSLGQKREDIVAGLHRAIVIRAMSLLARSGGVSDQFTFTGGVARNPAAVSAIEELVRENYGQRTLNISSDSIYTGALGAALFARRAA